MCLYCALFLESSTLSGLLCPSVLVINWFITLCNWTKIFEIYWSKTRCYWKIIIQMITMASQQHLHLKRFSLTCAKTFWRTTQRMLLKVIFVPIKYMMLLAFQLFLSHSYLVKIFYFKEQRFTWGLPLGATSQLHRWRKMSEHHSDEKQNMFSYKTPRKEGYECAFWLLTYIFIMLLDLTFSLAFLLPMKLTRCREDTLHSQKERNMPHFVAPELYAPSPSSLLNSM